MSNVSEFILRMNDQVSENASLAGRALGQLEAKIEREKEALGGLNDKVIEATASLQKMQVGNTDGKLDEKINKAKSALEGLQRKVEEKKGGIGALEGARAGLEETKAGTETLTGKVKGMADAMQDANGVTGKLTAGLKALGPEGAAVAAALAAVIAVATVLVGTFLNLASACISISQEKDALANTFEALSTGTESGVELVDSLSEVAAMLPQAEGKVLAWGKSLMAAGIEGEGLAVSVKAAASAAAIMGDEGASALINMEKQLAAGGAAADSLIKVVQQGGRKAAVQLANMGLKADDLAKSLGVTPEKMKTMKLTAEQLSAALEEALINKGAKSLETMGLTWGSIMGKLEDGWGDLFEDMGEAVAPFMGAVKDLFSEFSAGSTTMSGVKDVVTSVFTWIFSVATKAIDGIHKGFLYVEIGILHAAIALLPLGRALKSMAQNEDLIRGLKDTLIALAVPLVLLVGAATLVATGFVALGVAIVAVIGGIIAGYLWLQGASQRFWVAIGTGLKNLAVDSYNAAKDFIAGLVNGITEGAGAVATAVKGVAKGAVDSFTGFFKIQSPSRLMFEHGLMLPAGAAEGVEAGTDDVTKAVSDMSQAGAAAAGPMGGASAGGGGNAIAHGAVNVVINLYGVGEDIGAKVRDVILDVFDAARGEAATTVPA